MVKAVQDFLFGLFFGMGFTVASNVLNFIVTLLHGHLMKSTAKGGLESHENYKLPICDVTKERRNFDGGPVKYLCDLPIPDEGITSGTTETDSKTDPRQPNYSSAYRESGRPLPSHKGRQLSIKALGKGRI